MSRIQINDDVIYHILEFCDIREIFIIKVLILHQTIPDFIQEYREKFIDPYINHLAQMKISWSKTDGYTIYPNHKMVNISKNTYHFIGGMLQQIDIDQFSTAMSSRYQLEVQIYLNMCAIIRYYICYSRDIKYSAEFSYLYMDPFRNVIHYDCSNESVTIRRFISILQDIEYIEQNISEELKKAKSKYLKYSDNIRNKFNVVILKIDIMQWDKSH